jgi:hypothetical protein
VVELGAGDGVGGVGAVGVPEVARGGGVDAGGEAGREIDGAGLECVEDERDIGGTVGELARARDGGAVADVDGEVAGLGESFAEVFAAVLAAWAPGAAVRDEDEAQVGGAGEVVAGRDVGAVADLAVAGGIDEVAVADDDARGLGGGDVGGERCGDEECERGDGAAGGARVHRVSSWVCP